MEPRRDTRANRGDVHRARETAAAAGEAGRRKGESGVERLRDHLEQLLLNGQRLIVVSNRGPLSFTRDRSEHWHAQRGSGGLVTALAELGRIAPVTWVSAAMNPGDRLAAKTLGRRGPAARELESLVREQMPDQDLRLQFADVSDAAYDLHYATVSNPFLWFIQHRLYQLPYEPQVDDRLVKAWRDGYRVVNEALAQAAVAASSGKRPVVLLQDYHLYLAAATIRAARPDALLLHFNHIPWPSPDYWEVLPQALRRAICEGLLENDILGFQTDRYATNFLGTVDRFVRDARVDPAGRNVRWRGRTICDPGVPDLPRPERAAALRPRAGGGRAPRGAPGTPPAGRWSTARRAGRPARAIQERAAWLPGVRGAAPAPPGAPPQGPLPGHPVDFAREPDRVRRLRFGGAGSGRPRQRHGRPGRGADLAAGRLRLRAGDRRAAARRHRAGRTRSWTA